MFKVLGCFSADRAALYTVSRNCITNELSLFSQKDGNPICFFIKYYSFDFSAFIFIGFGTGMIPLITHPYILRLNHLTSLIFLHNDGSLYYSLNV